VNEGTKSDDVADDSEWIAGAMYDSEIEWFVHQLLDAKCDLLIECGRQDAISTRRFAEKLGTRGVEIFSIDFDDDPVRFDACQNRLRGHNVTLVSGDVHVHVPRLIEQHRDRRIAVLQDAAKGWEGLSTLLAAAFYEHVAVIAQHNLHLGHSSREFFLKLSPNPAFLEYGDCSVAMQLRHKEASSAKLRALTDRPIDHSSLGIIRLDGDRRGQFKEVFGAIVRDMRGWNSLDTYRRWQVGDLEGVPRLRKRVRTSPLRFMRR
jgi:hypothetical protein